MPIKSTTRVLKKCDVVMKGGITSGIVYPGAICQLANDYSFQSVGGTSAGAIAASLTAAAEYARSKGREVFEEVGKVPSWLGQKSQFASGSNLYNLFQPQKPLKSLFKFFASFLITGWAQRFVTWVEVLWLEMLIGFVPGGILAWLAHGETSQRTTVAILLSLFVGIAGAFVTAIVGLIVRLARLPKFRYGLCTGYMLPRKGAPPSLVEWLNERLNTLAAKPANQPLTFGDLKTANVELRMITTCITFGRPYTLPFDTAQFYYSPTEMREYFPGEVVDWMDQHPNEEKHAHDVAEHHERVELGDLKPLPSSDDLPVIVAARFSLSFPVLFCMVPLYAIDWTRRRRTKDEPIPAKRVPGDALAPDEPCTPERIWFSDGGICSNFPLHLFDAPLPDWPTFGIDLEDLRPDRPSNDDRVWMPTSNRGGIAQSWTRLGTSEGITGTGKLIFGIVDAARNWLDTLQTVVPGYRDRVVHIYLDKKEGGLNLNMAEETIKALSGYGVSAGSKLIDRFIHGTDGGKPTTMTWDNHRWIRFRSATSLLQEFVASFSHSLDHPEPGERSYLQLLARARGQEPTSYQLDDEQRQDAEQFAAGLEQLSAKMNGHDLRTDAPRPEPSLRVRPKF